MTDARIARCKATRLGRRSSLGNDPVPCCAHPCLMATAERPLDAHSALQLSPIILQPWSGPVLPAQSRPSPPSPQRSIPIEPAAPRCSTCPRLRALALLRRRTAARVESSSLPASEKPAHKPTSAMSVSLKKAILLGASGGVPSARMQLPGFLGVTKTAADKY